MDEILSQIKESIIEISKLFSKHHDLGDELDNKNQSGDTQKKLDIIADEILIKNLSKIKQIKALTSEEKDDIILLNPKGKYLVAFDPLDGSGNIKVNITTGTIFIIFDFSDNKINRKNILLSGYSVYGACTQLVIAYKDVNLYHLDNNIFYHVKKITKPNGKFYSINSSNSKHWYDETKQFIKMLNYNDYNMRWIGCMVGDVHRIIISGGIFLYPRDKLNKFGKIRLIYEAMPFAFIFEKLGGVAVDSFYNLNSILDIEPKDYHEKTGIILSFNNENI